MNIKIVSQISYTFRTIVALSLISLTAMADDYVEKGRFGVVALQTDDGTQSGFVYEGDEYESSLTFDGSMIDRKSSTPGTEQTGDIGVTLRGGWRKNIGSFNYLSFGALYHKNFFGFDNGVSTYGSWSAAPYVGLQRHFSGTNLMLSLYVEPFAYNHSLQNDGNGNQIKVNTYQFFQGGGFGIAYLF